MHVPFAEPNAMSTNISRLIPSVTNTSIHKGRQNRIHDRSRRIGFLAAKNPAHETREKGYE